MKECILIVNHDTGEYRLEKLNSNIAVKKTRWVHTNDMTSVLLLISSNTFLPSVICIDVPCTTF